MRCLAKRPAREKQQKQRLNKSTRSLHGLGEENDSQHIYSLKFIKPNARFNGTGVWLYIKLTHELSCNTFYEVLSNTLCKADELFRCPVRGSSGRKGQSAPNIPDPKFVSLIQFKVCLLLRKEPFYINV